MEKTRGTRNSSLSISRCRGSRPEAPFSSLNCLLFFRQLPAVEGKNRCSCWGSKIHEGSGEDCAPYPKVEAIPKAGRVALGIGG